MRRERLLFAAIAASLVVFRSVVPILFEGFYFDSDQAIVGLMARHLSTFHAFPLYYYGLNYLLGVQAWIIAPFFWVFRPSVASMRIPLVLLNVAVALWLVVAFSNRLKLRPAAALLAALPFIIPTPSVSGQLLETAGASIEPFAYVLLLWSLRHRAFAFGLALALGFLHREFTIFVLPAIVIVEAASGELWLRSSVTRAFWVAAGFALVWLIVDDLRMHLGGGSVALQAASLGGHVCLDPAELTGRTRAMATQALPALFGARPMSLSAFRMDTALVAGSVLVGWLVAVILVVTAGRLSILWARQGFAAKSSPESPERRQSGFGEYLALVGLFTACAYPLSCDVTLGAPPLLRYLLLALLLPVGMVASFMQREPSRGWRALVAAAVIVWSLANLADNARLMRASIATPPLNEHRALVDYLVAHRIRYARATYWDAYVIDFLSRERVIAASVDLVRIPEYQREVDAHAEAAVNLPRVPCAGGERIASWCIERE